MMATVTTAPLQGAVAFQAIASQLREGTEPRAPIAHPGLARLSRALQAHSVGGVGWSSDLDLAVLIRQALRFRERQAPGSGLPRLWIPSGQGWPSVELWEQVGVMARNEAGGFIVQARPWVPAWLPNAAPDGVDAASAGENQVRALDSVPGDPFLRRFAAHESYRTRGQRSAVRAAFSTPPGATLLVCLPTGDGKSYIFQLVASIGYGAKDGLPGVTLVVTPTVALAMDHQRAAKELCIAEHRLTYEAGMPVDERMDMMRRIRNGTQELCFASPEATCGVLRPALMAAAAAGFLRTIVVDEAHLVDAWGANFRASFQVLSGLRAEFLKAAPAPARPRTLLLSATLTAATVETLKTLFPGEPMDGPSFELVSAAQLRPEIEYWVAKPTGAAERARRVIEALLHMPRPAILYVTEVEHARQWYEELRKLGFRRLGMMTGKSPDDERRRVVQDWHDGQLDLVVGTSAFGLGIDNPHVRTVVHACVPETLDRFYQEVGRGGRDGCSSASIIVPRREYGSRARDDYDTARGLNHRRLLTVETAHRRWSAMFNRHDKQFEGDGVFRLRVDGPPGLESGYIDMVGETNTEWNVRALTLMANAGLIELLGPDSIVRSMDDVEQTDADTEIVEAESVKRIEQFQRVRVLDPRHLDIAVWQDVVEPHRERMEAAHFENLRRMFRFLKGKECAADTLAPVYQFDWRRGDVEEPVFPVHVATACGGCPDCRAHGRQRETEPAQFAKHPWPPMTRILPPALDLLDNSNRVVIFYPDELNNRMLRRWGEALAALVACGVRNLIVLPGAPIAPTDVQERVPGIAVFAADKLPPRDYLPPGPTAVIIPRSISLTERPLRPREATDRHFLFAHRDAEDPAMPGVLLRSRFEGPQLASLDLFIQRMLT